MAAETTSAASRWPQQIKYIVGNEACERFSYYGMRSILAGYITGAVMRGGLGQTADYSTETIHLFVAVNYFMPLFGAWLSDKVIGRYHTILWVSLFYCAGHGVLACSDLAHDVTGKMWCLFFGLMLIAFGSGGIKPCVSAFMGDQFKPEQSHLLQKAYGAFYWSINLGSFFSFLAIPWIQEHHGYSWAFGVPGILMAVATLVFWLGTKHYVRVPPTRQTKSAGFIPVFFTALRGQPCLALGPVLNLLATLGLPLFVIIALTFITFQHEITPAIKAVGWVAIGSVALWYALVLVISLMKRFDPGDKFWAAARPRYTEAEIAAARSVSPILFVFALIPVFWSLFDQTNSTWVLQGGKMLPLVIGGKYLLGLLIVLAGGLLVLAIRAGDFLMRSVATVLTGLGAVGGMIAVFMALTQHHGTEGNELQQAAVVFVVSVVLLALNLKCGDRTVRFLLGGVSLFFLGWFAVVYQSILTWTYRVGADEMQAANAGIVMILVPLFTLLIYPRLGRLASPLHRMSYGMFIAALSYVIVALLQQRIDAGAQLSIGWQLLPYTVLTTAEVLVSTTGLEFAFREAAPEMKSLIMSFWLLTTTVGDLFVVGITKLFSDKVNHAASVTSGRFMLYAGLVFVVAILFSVVARDYRYRDRAAAEGK
ncbi:MAG TPA: MFS transporter [Dongiaceae bacterium]|nr:MFS transporter [Dongiaceae bacterium]